MVIPHKAQLILCAYCESWWDLERSRPAPRDGLLVELDQTALDQVSNACVGVLHFCDLVCQVLGCRGWHLRFALGAARQFGLLKTYCLY